jgi:hypothetical protein
LGAALQVANVWRGGCSPLTPPPPFPRPSPPVPLCRAFGYPRAVLGQDEEAGGAQFADATGAEDEDADEDAATADEVLSEAAGDAEPIIDDGVIRVHPLTDIPAPAADVVTVVVFPNNAKKGEWCGRGAVPPH